MLSMLSLPLNAATISGKVRTVNGAPAVSAAISFSCPGKSFNGRTDNHGRYRVKGLPNVKWCQMRVNYGGKQSEPLRINSGSGSKDINVRLKNAGNAWQLIL